MTTSDTVHDDGIVTISKAKCHENASDQSFNDSKFFGTVCKMLAIGDPFVITSVDDTFVTKKGGMVLDYHISTRLGPKKVSYHVLSAEKTNRFKEWAKKNGVMTSIEDLSGMKTSSFNDEYRYTCGFLVKYGDGMTGHITRAFDVDWKYVCDEEESESARIGDVIDGEVVQIRIEEKNSGRIIHVPSLKNLKNEYPHITENTLIKSSLSGPVLQMLHLHDRTEFDMLELDPTAKKSLVLKLTTVSSVPVQISGWYSYVLQQKK